MVRQLRLVVVLFSRCICSHRDLLLENQSPPPSRARLLSCPLNPSISNSGLDKERRRTLDGMPSLSTDFISLRHPVLISEESELEQRFRYRRGRDSDRFKGR